MNTVQLFGLFVLTVSGMGVLLLWNTYNMTRYPAQCPITIQPVPVASIQHSHSDISCADGSPPIQSSDDLKFILYGEGQAEMTDPRLVRYIRSQLAAPPEDRGDGSQLGPDVNADRSEVGQSTFVDQYLKRKKNGFFIECGAQGGVAVSTTLFLETARNWSGLLIEANPRFHQNLLSIRRNAYVLGACLSPTRKPGQLKFLSQRAGLSGLVDTLGNARQPNTDPETATLTVSCYPFNSVMAALGVRHVDYFSLDVEGAELDILKTIDWNQLSIGVIGIEYRLHDSKGIDPNRTLAKLEDLRGFFNKTGKYKEIGLRPEGDYARGLDIFFASV